MNEEQLKKGILELLAKPGARPLTKSEMARALGLAPKERAHFRRVLDAMVADGVLNPGKKARIEVANSEGRGGKGRLIGRIRVFPKGHATVYPDLNDLANDLSGFDLESIRRIYVPNNRTGTAMDGDTVEVSVELKRGRDGEVDPQGAVTQIVERTDRLVVGVYFNRNGFTYIQPDAEALPATLEVEPCAEAETGQKVAVKLIEWRKGEDPRGRVEEVIGWPDSPGVDIMSVVHKYGLQTDFPPEVLAEAEAVAVPVPGKEKERREDWTDRLVITIDPFDAKDHDDAIWVSPRPGGGWTLAVHIADVSHYVKPGTRLDKEALKRGNSTYLVDRVLPMLPEVLSNGICSLRPDEERLTKCAILEIEANGLVRKSTFVDAFINSQAKLSYEQAQAVLDGGSVPGRFKGQLKKDLEAMIREAWKMASVLRQRRFKRGALDMEMDEIKVLVDESSKDATGYAKVEHCESHQLIEECMLAANEAVAKVLRDRNKPAIYRVHDDPDPEKLMEYGELARVHGYQVGDLTNRAHVQKLLDQAKGTPEEHNIKLGLLRSLKRAEYSEEPLGHYGLAKADYAHFTSPIRRYADLVVHRALQHLLKNRPAKPDRSLTQQQCKEAAIHISETERNSSFAEQETKTLKLLEWLERTRQSESPPLFEGVVTEVRSMGTFVEATDIMQKGLVKVADLPGRGWRFNGGGPSFVKADKHVQSGVQVKLKVAKVDFIEQRVDFAIVEIVPGQDLSPLGEETPRKSKKKSRRGSQQTGGGKTKSQRTARKASRRKVAEKAPPKGKAKSKPKAKGGKSTRKRKR
ncbi:ribonuclease R [Roseibacillus ishigakijimensis]|uniref:Ribonuclease R n=1 Tax=Roseibacillus ishigakijimensis TaxID=454146 RepID=A0A934RSS3_9BACT|nr:ribonuclease R [Roseibacillus ishigakijimensis]MBK1833841.1 ribonuclease R [Roseibacillus ishigakijimensis]